jgi:hypothetical protein
LKRESTVPKGGTASTASFVAGRYRQVEPVIEHCFEHYRTALAGLEIWPESVKVATYGHPSQIGAVHQNGSKSTFRPDF